MPYRDGWRNGERGRETPSHLTADRLADILGAMPAESSEPSEPLERSEPSEPPEPSEPSEPSETAETAEPSQTSDPSESVTTRLFRGAPERKQAAQPPHPSGAQPVGLDRSESVFSRSAAVVPVVEPPAVTAPVVKPPAAVVPEGEPSAAVTLVDEPPAATAPVVEPIAVSKGTGRHRRPPLPKFHVWRFAFTSRSLLLMGVLTLLVVVSVAYSVLA
jgi:hypothetical protein